MSKRFAGEIRTVVLALPVIIVGVGPALWLAPSEAVAQSSQGIFSKIFSGFAKPRPSRVDNYRPQPRYGRRSGVWGGSANYTYAPFAVFGAPSQSYRLRPRPRIGRYRTMCVRLCDGYYWPVSFSATQWRFSRDGAECEASCRSGARLYVMPSYGDKIANMRDLSGKRYSTLENAFLYRKQLVANCTCRPDPWSEEARMRHKRYAGLINEKEGSDSTGNTLQASSGGIGRPEPTGTANSGSDGNAVASITVGDAEGAVPGYSRNPRYGRWLGMSFDDRNAPTYPAGRPQDPFASADRGGRRTNNPGRKFGGSANQTWNGRNVWDVR